MPPAAHDSMVTALCFHESRLCSGDASGHLILWALEQQGSMEAVAKWKRPDGAAICGLASFAGTLWALSGGQLQALSEYQESRDLTARVVLSPAGGSSSILCHRGQRLLLGSERAVFRFLWHGDQWNSDGEFPVETPISELDVSHDGEAVLAVDGSSQVRIYDRAGRMTACWSRKGVSELSARFSPTGHDTVYFGTRGHYDLQRVNAISGKGRVKLGTRSVWMVPLAVSADGRFLAVRDKGQEVQVFDLAHDRPLFRMQPMLDRSREHLVAGMSRVPAGFAPVGDTGLEVTSWRRPPQREGHHTALAVAEDRVAMGTRDGAIWLTHVRNCSVIRADRSGVRVTVPPCCEVLLELPVRAIGRQGRTLRALGHSGELFTIDVDSGRVEAHGRKLKVPKMDRDIARHFHQHGQIIVRDGRIVIFEKKELHVLDFVTGKLLASHPTPISRVVELPGGLLVGYPQYWNGGPRRIYRVDLEGSAFDPLDLEGTFDSQLEPTWGGGTTLVLMDYEGYDRVFSSFDVRTGTRTRLGAGLWAHPSFDGRHFALSGETWSKWTIFRGIHEVGRGQAPDDFGALGLVVVLPEADRLFLVDQGPNRVTALTQAGSVVSHLAGHAEDVAGLCPAGDLRTLVSWDRAGVFRRWSLETPAGDTPILSSPS